MPQTGNEFVSPPKTPRADGRKKSYDTFPPRPSPDVLCLSHLTSWRVGPPTSAPLPDSHQQSRSPRTRTHGICCHACRRRPLRVRVSVARERGCRLALHLCHMYMHHRTATNGWARTLARNPCARYNNSSYCYCIHYQRRTSRGWRMGRRKSGYGSSRNVGSHRQAQRIRRGLEADGRV